MMKPWPLTIRILHFALAIAVTVQLVSIMFVNVDLKHVALTTSGILFKIHEYSGLTALTIVALHIVLVLIKQERRAAYFPWPRQERVIIGQEVKALASGSLPQGGYLAHGVVGFVHGMGLLAVLAAGSLGSLVFIALQHYPASAGVIKPVVETHQFFAALVVAYWVSHAGMVLWHFLSGDREILRIFSLK